MPVICSNFSISERLGIYIRHIQLKKVYIFFSALLPGLDELSGLHFTSDIYTYTNEFTLGIPEGAACLCVLKSLSLFTDPKLPLDSSACCQLQSRVWVAGLGRERLGGAGLGQVLQHKGRVQDMDRRPGQGRGRTGFRAGTGGQGRTGLDSHQQKVIDMHTSRPKYSYFYSVDFFHGSFVFLFIFEPNALEIE